MKSTVILTTKWEMVDLEVGKAREQELRTSPLFFKPLLDLQASMVDHATQNSHESALGVVTRMVERNTLVTLQIQMELVDEGLDVSETSAGKIITQHLTERLQQAEEEHQKRVEELRAQQERQQVTALMEIQTMLERDYQQKVAELESRRRVMQVDVEGSGLSEIGREVMRVLDSVAQVVSCVLRGAVGTTVGHIM